MKFCTVCENMYYVGVQPDKLIYYCRKCKSVDENLEKKDFCVLNTQLQKGGQTFNHIINKYTKLDPTLPRIYNIKCPNGTCETNQSGWNKPVEVIYMRYDDSNMKYLYICTNCECVWKTDDRK